jgi:hypothetical protein
LAGKLRKKFAWFVKVPHNFKVTGPLPPVRFAAILFLTLGSPIAGAEAIPEPQPAADAVRVSLPDAPSAVLASSSMDRAVPSFAAPPDLAGPEAKLPVGVTPCDTMATQKRTMSAEEMKAEESQYIAAVVPNFNTVFGGCSPPLTAGQKWSLVYHGAIVPFTIALDAVVAGSDEITGSHNGYGWGPEGYFKRFGAEYADTVSAGVIGNGLLPVLLHQDPRFYQLGAGHPLIHRVIHAAQSDFVCRGDNGKLQFNWSNIVGNFLAGALSNAYYPADDRGVALTLENAVKVTAEGALGSQLLEFSPELSHFGYRLTHHWRPAPDEAAAPVAVKPTAQ